MKLFELINEGYWKNRQIDSEFDKATDRRPAKFGVMINGKVWTRNGVPIEFKDYASAQIRADKITADRNITTQVIPLKK